MVSNMHIHIYIYIYTLNVLHFWHVIYNLFHMLACFAGENGCTMNVHLLRHLPECLCNLGPLWAYSCFPFESMNGHMEHGA